MIKEKIKEKVFETSCDFCGTYYEYSMSDVHPVFGGYGFTCPKCGEDIIVEAAPPFSYPLSFQHSNEDNSIRITDKEVQGMIDEVKKQLLSSNKPYDYGFISTGDAYVFGCKNEDGEVSIVVARDFYESIEMIEDLR